MKQVNRYIISYFVGENSGPVPATREIWAESVLAAHAILKNENKGKSLIIYLTERMEG